MKYICRITLLLSISLFSSIGARAELNLELPDLNLPHLGGESGHFISAIKEGEQGLKILRNLRARGELIEDPEINLWIRALGNKLASRAPRSATPFYFAVSKNTSVNAFATIGGVIVINGGLILKSSSESELAAVMSHEIAHVTQRHIQRMVANEQRNKFATGAALVVGAIAATQNAEAGAAILNGTIATSAHHKFSFGRAAEAEADRVGIRILANANYNPKAMPDFLQKLEQFDNSKTSDIREFLQNHPLTVKRVSDVSLRARQFGPFKGKENPRYFYMREKIRALLKASHNAEINTPQKVSAQVKHYASALRLQQRNAYVPALNLAVKMKKSNNLSEKLLLAELYNQNKQFNNTISLLKSVIQIYPGNEAITVPLAQALISSGKFEQAWKVLQDVNESEQTSLEIFEIKQELARVLGNNSQAFRAVAQRSIRTGRYKSADLQLRQAIRFPGSSIIELQEMQQMLESISKHNK